MDFFLLVGEISFHLARYDPACDQTHLQLSQLAGLSPALLLECFCAALPLAPESRCAPQFGGNVKKKHSLGYFLHHFSTTKIQKNQRNFDQATLATLTTPSFTAPREPIHRILHYLLPRASDLRPGDGPRLGWIYGICRGGIGFGFRYC